MPGAVAGAACSFRHDPARQGEAAAGAAAGRAPAHHAAEGAAPGARGGGDGRGGRGRGRGGHARGHAGRGGGGQGAARYNIQLNQQIAACESTREVCSLIEEHAAAFNHVNVATAFRKLLQAPRAGMPRGVVEHSLEALEQRALQTMEDFGPQAIANTLHMMAKKRYRPANTALLPALEGRLRAVAGESTPQDIANTLWAACFFAIDSPQVLGGLLAAFGDSLLPSADLSQFDERGLCQLHQVFLMCSLDADVRGSLPESIRRLKDRLGDACRAAFVESSDYVTESRLQKDVSQAMQRMELVVEEEYRCPKSGYSIDIRVRKSSAHGSSEAEGWAVEVDGPYHFLSCKSPNGATLIKQRLLDLLGYNLVSVPYWEWDELLQDKRAQEAYLRSKLAVKPLKVLADRSVDDSVCFPSHDQDKFPDTDSIRGVDEEQQPP